MDVMSSVGEPNTEFILNYAGIEAIELVFNGLGDIYPRQVLFDPVSGKAWIKRIKDSLEYNMPINENAYRHEITTKPIVGDIHLF